MLVSEGTGLLSVIGWQEGDNAMLMIDVMKIKLMIGVRERVLS